MLRASKNSVKSNRSSSSGGAGLKFSFLRSSRTSVKSNRSSVGGRSFISRARQSFFRSKGDRGADVITLRGITGSDFEGEARVTRGDIGMGLCFSCFFVDRGGEPNKKRYVLVKGTNLFVFTSATAKAPKYAIDLPHKKIVLHEEANGGHSQTVTIENSLGDVEYKFQFDLKENPNLARSFAHALKEEAAVGETNEIKKKLGHEPAFKPTKSIRYADTVAEEKRKHQPDPPVSTGDGIRETTPMVMY